METTNAVNIVSHRRYGPHLLQERAHIAIEVRLTPVVTAITAAEVHKEGPVLGISMKMQWPRL